MKIECYGMIIDVSDSVYEPSEDTFLLADNLNIHNGDNVLEIGTGTGIIAILAARKAARVVAVDINLCAVTCAKENAKSNQIKNIDIFESDLFSNVNGKFDVIIFNTPYVPTEEDEICDECSKAWDGGADGREVIDRFICESLNFIEKKGKILILESSVSSYEKTIKFFESSGLLAKVIAHKKESFETIVLIEVSN